MSELKAMLSRVIREGGNFVSRDKAAEALREYTDKEKSFQSRISELEDKLDCAIQGLMRETRVSSSNNTKDRCASVLREIGVDYVKQKERV